MEELVARSKKNSNPTMKPESQIAAVLKPPDATTSGAVDPKTRADILMKEWAECGRMMTWCGGQMIANMTFGATIIAALAVGGSRLREIPAETWVKFLLILVIVFATLVAWAFMYFGWIQLHNLAHYWEMCLARAAVVEHKLDEVEKDWVRLAREAIILRSDRASPHLRDLATEAETELKVDLLAPVGICESLRRSSRNSAQGELNWGRTKFGVVAVYTIFGYASVAVIALLSIVAVVNSGPPNASASDAGTPDITTINR